MKKFDISLIIGIALVLVGALFLLDTFNVFEFRWEMIFPLLFGIGGLIFLGVYATNREQWWALIPGSVLLGLAILIGLTTLLPNIPHMGAIGGAVFMAFIALPFWLIYITKREFWWAVIPAGTLTSITLVILLSEFVDGGIAGGMFLLGLALTFGLVYILPTPEGKMTWAIYPAAVLLVLSMITLVTTSPMFNFVWPLVLVAAGVYLIVRTRKVS